MLIVLSTAGCAYMMPPQKIPMDRVNYLEAVSTSWKEQLLSNLVRLRYGDTLTSLEMTSVTTGYELDVGLSAGNTINWRAFPKTTGFHDTTLIGATAAYSDKPTITYVPMKGDALANTMLEPIGPLKILKNLQTATLETASLLPYCVKSINGLRSRDDIGFYQLATKFQELSEKGVIRITIKEPPEPKVTTVPTEYTVTLDDKRQKSGRSGPAKAKDSAKLKQGENCEESTDKKDEGKPAKAIAFLVLDNDRARREGLEDEVKSFKNLLWSNRPSEVEDLQKRYEKYEIINGNEEPPLDPCCEKVIIQTRSILQTLVLMSGLIHVPNDEKNAARKGLQNASYELLKNFKIYSKDEHPQNAFVAIRYCGHWFFIDNGDIYSKIVFSSILGVFSMAETGTSTGVPVLTLPVQ
ncbi:MAG: hypothetical protein ABSH41_04055 [Syntrophobacteraceae bacterium]